MSDDQILAIRDVADLPRYEEKAIYSMAQAGDLLGLKLRGQCRFRRFGVDAWIAAQVDRVKACQKGVGGDE